MKMSASIGSRSDVKVILNKEKPLIAQGLFYCLVDF